jgi:hypothetical protein
MGKPLDTEAGVKMLETMKRKMAPRPPPKATIIISRGYTKKLLAFGI